MKPPNQTVINRSPWLWRLALAGWAGLELMRPVCGLALDPGRDILQYNCQTWNRQNGLPGNGINAIAQTKAGYLWLGTSVGLVRFDGVGFNLLDLSRVSELRSSVVTSLANAQAGGLWVGLENGAFGYYDERAFSFRGRPEWGQVNMNVRSLVESRDGTLWLASERQAARLPADGRYEELLSTISRAAPNVLRAFEDSQGRVWFGTSSLGAYFWEAGKFQQLPDPTVKTVICMAEGRDGRIWLGTEKGLKCYARDLKPIEVPALPEEIRALLVDRNGVLWIGTAEQGLVRYWEGAYSYLKKADGLAGNFVTALAEDREGSLWVGTHQGLSQLTDVKFATRSITPDAPDNAVCAVASSRRGGIWAGSGQGLTYFDRQTKTYAAEAGLPGGNIKRVFEAANGEVYLVNKLRTLLIFSGDKVVATNSAPTLIVGMAEDARGVVVSVGGKLYRAGTNYLTPYLFTNGEPNFDWILNLASGRDGSLWVGCATGIFRVKDGSYQQWSEAQGLVDPHVQMICEDQDGTVWAALLTGIARLKDGKIQCISRKNGLFDDNIYAIVPDDLGCLWIDSGRGIFRVRRQGLDDFADGRTNRVECAAYDGPESVTTADKTAAQEHVGCKSLDGRIWFPSSKGVVVIDPARIPENRIEPPVRIESIRANDLELPRGGTSLVKPGKGELEIHFTGLSLIASQKMRFRYQLKGYDRDWVDAGDRRLAFYTNLKPGQYTFRVIAANADGIWNRTGDSFVIQLLPHFYETAWFYLACGGLALAALAGAFNWRVRHLKRKQREMQEARIRLETEVANRTAELAQANASLQEEEAQLKQSQAQLKQRTQSLEGEIEERKRVELEVEKVHRQLMDASRQAGMAEVATSVLHNVGNVLNSVNISGAIVSEKVRNSRVVNLGKAVELIETRKHDLGRFFTEDSRGRQLPAYLASLATHLAEEQGEIIKELSHLTGNIEHIKEIVAMQQSYGRVAGLKEPHNIVDLIEDALRMNTGALDRHQVTVIRDYQQKPVVEVDKHKVLQILINLIRNAKYALDEGTPPVKQMTLRVSTSGDERVKIEVIDNGVGIPPENLTRIFAHGFTTRKEGHGFGLHSGALAARELGGLLSAHSEGHLKGAAFVLEFPFKSAISADAKGA